MQRTFGGKIKVDVLKKKKMVKEGGKTLAYQFVLVVIGLFLLEVSCFCSDERIERRQVEGFLIGLKIWDPPQLIKKIAMEEKLICDLFITYLNSLKYISIDGQLTKSTQSRKGIYLFSKALEDTSKLISSQNPQLSNRFASIGGKVKQGVLTDFKDGKIMCGKEDVGEIFAQSLKSMKSGKYFEAGSFVRQIIDIMSPAKIKDEL